MNKWRRSGKRFTRPGDAAEETEPDGHPPEEQPLAAPRGTVVASGSWLDDEERLFVSTYLDGDIWYVVVRQEDTWGDRERVVGELLLGLDEAAWLRRALGKALVVP